MEFLPLLLLPFLLLASAGWLITKVIDVIVNWIKLLRERRRIRIERELDRKQAELRQTMFTIAEQLSLSAHEARKALIRESFLASRRAPGERE